MAGQRFGDDVSEYLSQNPELAQWIESFRGYCESNKQWSARREFILRNMDAFPMAKPRVSGNSSSLDRLLSLSMVWANHVFLGCSYPAAVMDKIEEMGEGIEVQDPPVHKTTKKDGIAGRGKRSAADEAGADDCVKRARTAPNEPEGWSAGRTAARTASQKSGPPPQAPKEHQPFFNRLYKAVAWKLVSAGGFGPNLDHFEILRSCVESCKQTLTCVYVPLKDITGLPAGRTQDGHVCEIRCQTVYLGTGYGRDESAAKAMASKEALKVFQGQKVTVKICRRRYKGRDVEDLLLLDELPRTQGFPPALSYPFQDEQQEDGSS